jgi:putative DNA primase/helicase
MADPFTPLAGGKQITKPQPAKSAQWVPLVPVPANAPEAPATHLELGKPTAIWAYRDQTGRLLGHICRFDTPDSGKQFRPLTYCNSSGGRLAWRWQGWPEPRPLYGLDRLGKRPGAPVVVCEGEKSADAAAELLPDHVAVTSPNGAKSARHADWQPLAGRKVVLWPDADSEGAAYADTVGKLLAPLAASVQRVTPPAGAPEGWDAADALAKGWDRDQAKALVDGAGDALAPKKKRGRKAIAGAAAPSAETEERTPRLRQKPGMLEILKGVDLWYDPSTDVAYATIKIGDDRENHRENHAVR